MILPHVTQVLGAFADFGAIHPDVLNAAAERGTRVHQACAIIARGLFPPPVEPDITGYVKSFRLWLPLVEKVLLVEQSMEHPAFGYQGTPDLVVIMKGDQAATLVDLKTPAIKNRLWAAQTAAYKAMVNAHHKDLVHRTASLRLKKDGGRPIFDEYTTSHLDFNAFLSALNAYRWFKGE